MMIFVPKSNGGLSKIEAQISSIPVREMLEKLRNYKKEMDAGRVNLSISLPKFKIETEMSLNEPLEKVNVYI